jgi:hypothetical protein
LLAGKNPDEPFESTPETAAGWMIYTIAGARRTCIIFGTMALTFQSNLKSPIDHRA